MTAYGAEGPEATAGKGYTFFQPENKNTVIYIHYVPQWQQRTHPLA